MPCLNEGNPGQAPRYSIPARRLGALEHPLIIKDVDRGIKSFGPTPSPSLESVSKSLALNFPNANFNIDTGYF